MKCVRPRVGSGKRRVVSLLLLSGLTAAAGQAQARAQSGAAGSWPSAPASLPLRELAERRFDGASGLHATTAFAMALDSTGTAWIAADDGLYRYVSGTWRRDVLQDEFDYQQVRSLLFDRAGTAWVGTRRGVIRRPVHGTPVVYRDRNGLPGPVAYSLAESRAVDGTPRIVVGGSNGVAWFNGSAFVPLSMPRLRAPWVGVMVASAVSPQGDPVLWAANSAGGVASFSRGSWRIFDAAEGLTPPDAQFILPIDSGALRGVYVATIDGVFASTGVDSVARFAVMTGSPRGVFRLAFVPRVGGGDELWAGTIDGTLWRYRRGSWVRIESSISARRGTVTLLQAFADHGGGTSIYASARNGSLARLTYGVAASADLTRGQTLPLVTALTATSTAGQADHLWVGTQDNGLLEIPPVGPIRVHPFAKGMTHGLATLLRRVVVSAPSLTPPTESSTVAIAANVPWQQRGANFEAFGTGLSGEVIHDLARVRMPTGLSSLVVSTDRGVREWSGKSWEVVPGLDGDPVAGILDGSVDGEAVLYLGADHAVRIFGRKGLRVDSLPAVGSVSTGKGVVSHLCRTRSRSGARIFALDSERGVFWRDETGSGTWHAFPASPIVPLTNMGVLNLACMPAGEVAVSSYAGLTIFDVSSSDTTDWHVRAAVSDADGLPSVMIGTVAQGSSGSLWTGTAYGLGVVDLARAAIPPSGKVLLNVTVGMTGAMVREGAELTGQDDDIRVDPQLLAYHREESTRYRVRITRKRPWTMGGGTHAVGDESGQLLEASSRMYHDLMPGDYTIEARAYDWAGREYGPVVQHFSIETPIGLRWYALVSYLLLIGGGLTSIYRFRVGTIKRANVGLIASERRALDSERRFRTLFEQALDAHLLVGNGRVQAANAEAAHLLGSEKGRSLIGANVSTLLGDTLPIATSGDRQVRRGDLLVPVQYTVTEVPTDDGPLLHIVLRDLTDVRKAEAERAWFEAQVREAQKLESLGTLAGGVAHDFNNLLGVVRGNTELARTAQRKGRSTEEYLVAILDASDRARDIVKQILTFSRRSTPTREYVNLSSLIVDLQPLLRRMVPRTVTMSVEGTDAVHLLMGDPTQLQQLLLNLVSNADYAMRGRTDGQLVISVSSTHISETLPAPNGDVVLLRVRDNGEGMSEEVRARIFEPFFTTKPTGEGTGLGMAVVHGIVMSHEGRAEVSSSAGQGTTFEMRFPKASLAGLFDDELDEHVFPDDVDIGVTENLLLGTPPRGTQMPTPVDSMEGADAVDNRFAGTTIVVVDDEPTVARVVERALEQHGHVVRVFLTPEPALDYIREHVHSVDLLITDQTMPGMTGDQLAESVKAMRPNLPVLILTGYSHRLTAERVAAVRARAVLLKPVELEVLKRAVDDALAAGASSGNS